MEKSYRVRNRFFNCSYLKTNAVFHKMLLSLAANTHRKSNSIDPGNTVFGVFHKYFGLKIFSSEDSKFDNDLY